MFAETHDAVWQSIITALSAIAILWLQQRSAMAAAKLARDLATVATTKIETVIAVVAKSDEKTDATLAKIEEVQHATNGMKSELVAEVRRASFAQGAKSEKDKQEPCK